MNAVALDVLPLPPRPSWTAWLRRELAPFPSREITTLRLVITVAIVTITSLALQIPQLFFSAFFVFFVTKENRVLTMITGVLMIVGVIISMSLSLFLYRFTFDHPELRIPVMAVLIFTGMFLSRVFVLGPLGFVIGFFAALTQTTAESAANTDSLVRGLLWLLISIVYPVALTIIINQILLPAHPWNGLAGALAGRLEAVAVVLRRMLKEGTAGGQANFALLDLATRGSSPLSALLNFAEVKDYQIKRRHRPLVATIAASEHLATASAALELRQKIALSDDDRLCAESLLVEITQLQSVVGERHPILPAIRVAVPATTLPQLRELQIATRSFHDSLVGDAAGGTHPTPPQAKKPLFVPMPLPIPFMSGLPLKSRWQP